MSDDKSGLSVAKGKLVPREPTTVAQAPDTASFQALVLDHYARHARDLPWRRTRDAYHILVSEMMLQQTQVARVLDKYEPFVQAFPDGATLAAAPLQKVLLLWQGLGYNRRAVALHRAAQRIVDEHGGDVPQSPVELLRLPGVGPSTAGAVCAFAFGLPTAFVETNIRAVFIHHYFSDRPVVSDAEILPLVEETLDTRDPRRWFYALMDYGVEIKATHANPGRRSRHYARQSPFSGSTRELRAKVLRMVLSKGVLAAGTIGEAFPPDEAERVTRALADLTREGFLRLKDDRYSVR